MRRARRMLAMGAMAPAVASGPAGIEGHYLQFDGSTDYAYADAVFGGVSGAYTIAIKIAGRNGIGGLSETYFAAGGPGSNASARQRRDTAYGLEDTSFAGTSNAGSYGINTAAFIPADTGPRVIAIKRPAAGGALLRVISDGAVEYSASATGTTTYAKPDHLVVGGRCDDPTLAPVADRYGAVKLIGILIAAAEIPDAELIAWLAADTAEGNVTAIDHYWVASDISGASIPAKVGTVALTCVNVVAGDLVAL